MDVLVDIINRCCVVMVKLFLEVIFNDEGWDDDDNWFNKVNMFDVKYV